MFKITPKMVSLKLMTVNQRPIYPGLIPINPPVKPVIEHKLPAIRTAGVSPQARIAPAVTRVVVEKKHGIKTLSGVKKKKASPKVPDQGYEIGQKHLNFFKNYGRSS